VSGRFAVGPARDRRLGVRMACGNLATEAVSFGQAGRLGFSFGNCWRLILLIISKIRLWGVDFRHSWRCSKRTTFAELKQTDAKKS
jgi:hypothetical protein